MGRYTALYEESVINGPGDARPTAMQILEDENRFDGSLNGKVAIVTGCTSGIGPATAAAFHKAGMDVWCTGRGLPRIEESMRKVGIEPSDSRIHFLDMDLGEQASVRRAAADFLTRSKDGKLNILINNAGVMAAPQGMVTKDGLDVQFGTNHIGHFLFFMLLRDALLAGSSPEFQSRIVSVSSSAHRFGTVRFDDLNFTKRPEEYKDGYPAYGQSKTANIWMANYIERLYGSQGLHAFSLMPGGIETPLQRHRPDLTELIRTNPAFMKRARSIEQGAATSVWAAVARELEGTGGKYLENCEVAPPLPESWTSVQYGYAPWAYDPEGEEKLWKLSLDITGM